MSKEKKVKDARELKEFRRRTKLVKELEAELTGREYSSRPIRWGKVVPRVLVMPNGSKVPKAKSRSDLLLDRAVLQQLAKKLASGGTFALTAKPGRPVPNRTQKQLHKTKRFGVATTLARHARGRLSKITDLGLAGDPVRNAWKVHTPNWDHVSDVIKAVAYGAAIPDRRRFTFTLNLSPDIQVKALRSKGFAKFMQDRIARELRKVFPGKQVGFVFVVEGAYDVQGVEELIPFHLHGAIEVPDYVLDGEIIEFTSHEGTVAEALRVAGGKFAGKARARQVKLDPMYNVVGWFSYLAKARFITARALRSARQMARIPLPPAEGIVAATSKLRAAGQRWFNEARATEVRFAVRAKKRLPR